MGVGTHTFQAVLEHIEGTGETRIITHQRDGIAELGVVGWAMTALEMDSYMTVKKKLMIDEGLSRADLENMSASARAVFEARVFDRMRNELPPNNGPARKKPPNKRASSFSIAVPIPLPD